MQQGWCVFIKTPEKQSFLEAEVCWGDENWANSIWRRGGVFTDWDGWQGNTAEAMANICICAI